MSRTFRVPSFVPWAAAACVAVVAAWFTQLYSTSRTEVSLFRDQQALADLALRSTRNQLEAERIVTRQQLAELNQQNSSSTRALADAEAQLANARAQIATLARPLKTGGGAASFTIITLTSRLDQPPQALAVAVWDQVRQEGVLKVEKLPALASDQDYQLWVVDPQYPAPVDGGVFTIDAQTGDARIRFTARQPVKTVNALAVTRERKGGVPKAEGPCVCWGNEPGATFAPESRPR